MTKHTWSKKEIPPIWEILLRRVIKLLLLSITRNHKIENEKNIFANLFNLFVKVKGMTKQKDLGCKCEDEEENWWLLPA